MIVIYVRTIKNNTYPPIPKRLIAIGRKTNSSIKIKKENICNGRYFGATNSEEFVDSIDVDQSSKITEKKGVSGFGRLGTFFEMENKSIGFTIPHPRNNWVT